MYGTLARLRVKAGKNADLVAYVDRWNRERAPKLAGVRSVYLLTPDKAGAETLMLAVFADKASYRANAEDPEQDGWHQQLLTLLDGEPVWEDGEISGA